MKIGLIILILLSLCSFPIFSQKIDPKVLEFKTPVYPLAALAIRVSGKVIVDATIDRKGKVVAAKIEEGHPLLNVSALTAAKQWRFSSQKNLNERNVKITFFYSFKSGENPRNKKKDPTYNVTLIEPYTLKILVTVYHQIQY